MSTAAVQEDTFRIERFYPASPQRVFAAFADPQRKRRWFAEGDTHAVEDFAMRFEVGGQETLSYRLNAGTPFEGVRLAHRGAFLDIVPEARIVAASTMEFGGKRISAALETFEFIAVDGGTRLVLTHQAVFFEGADGPQMRRQGWQQLLDRMEQALARA
ncbi:SRPBCC family protein [Massilia sp. 9096]|uniref:SRPBCC family protein n=1 Tax=Massilia sp. 9096 TaxID=1500894 RepID=UPI00056063D4|nr:SRPBCC family protein [Massilia sp. 9096]